MVLLPSAQSPEVTTLTTLLHKELFQRLGLSVRMKDGTDINHNKKAPEASLGLLTR